MGSAGEHVGRWVGGWGVGERGEAGEGTVRSSP